MPAIRGSHSKKKTRRHTRNLDQIHADLCEDGKHLKLFKDTKAAEDLPGGGQWYCIECAKWYQDGFSFESHKKGKPHKRRVKQLQEEPHTTQATADAAIGLWTDNGKARPDTTKEESTEQSSG